MPHLGEIEIFTPAEGIEMVAPSGVIRGPDDRIWFTAIGNDRLGRVDPNTGQIDVYADPAGALHLPANVYPGPDDRSGSRAWRAIALGGSIPPRGIRRIR
jgi:streptogramin lyase